MSYSIFAQAGIDIPSNLPDKKISTIFNATGLNWEVTQQPLFRDKKTQLEKVPIVANVRSDNDEILGFVNPRAYKIVQNKDAFDFIDLLPNFTFEKVGMFNKGKKVYVVGKSDEQIDIDGSGDLVDFYLTFLHGHDGKSGIRFILCPIRMFCTNQLNLMLDTAKFKYNIAHTGDVTWKLQQIQKAIAHSRQYVSSLSDVITSMINTKPSMSMQNFVEHLIQIEDDDSDLVIARKEVIRDKIISLYNDKDDLQNYKGTSFGYLSAVSDYVSHMAPKRMVDKHTINNLFIKNLEGNELIIRSQMLLAA